MKTNRLGSKNADLFMYISEAGNEVDLKAEHINQYIRATSGEGFTGRISEHGVQHLVVLNV